MRTNQPLARFGPADGVTAVRALLMAMLAAVLVRPQLPSAEMCVVLAACAAALDGVDGWLARRTRTASDFGARFDMEVDALLILVLSMLAWRYDKAGSWVIASGLLRYGFVAGGAFLRWLQQPLEPSRRRQTICVVQILGLIFVLLPAVTRPLTSFVAAATLAALCWSFLTDIVWLWKRRTARSHLRSPDDSASFGKARQPASAKASAVRRSFSEGGSAKGAKAAGLKAPPYK